MSKFSIRQPLVLRAGIAIVGMGLVRIVAWAGWIPNEWAEVDADRIEQFIDLAILGITWRSTHKVVTPSADPRASDGTKLIPMGYQARPAYGSRPPGV